MLSGKYQENVILAALCPDEITEWHGQGQSRKED